MDRAPHISAPRSAQATSPLTPDHVRELSAARTRSKKIRRAASIAAISGWSMVAFAFLTLLGLLFGEVSSLIVGFALGAIAVNELRGAALLRHFDLRGPRILGYNQLALAILIIAYAAWSLMTRLNNPILASIAIKTGDPNMDATIAQLETLIVYTLYITLAVVGAIVPPLTAWYYFSRAKLIRAFLTQTPDWVTQSLRAAA